MKKIIELKAKISVSAGLFITAAGIRAGNEPLSISWYVLEAIADIIERYAEDVKELEEELEKCNASNL